MRSSTVPGRHATPHHERIDPRTDSEALLMHLDLRASPARPARVQHWDGRAVHCYGDGVPRELGVAALRFSFGKDSTAEDVEAVSAALPRIVEKYAPSPPLDR